MANEKQTAKKWDAESNSKKEEVEHDDFLPASEIPVCTFREILLWPFVLTEDDTKEGFEPAKSMRDIARAIEGEEGWESVPDLVDHVQNDPGESFGGEGRDHPQAWAEIVYFHDFVQRALFRETRNKWPDADAPIWLLRNRRLAGLEVETGGRRLRFAVDRLNLYLFPTGVAILALEVALEKWKDDLPLPHLADIQCFMDYFRRWHVPYWDEKKAPGLLKPGLLLEKITWRFIDGGEKPFDPADPDFSKSQQQLLDSDLRTPPPLAHWRELLPAAIGDHLAALSRPQREKEEPEAMRGLHWRSISDERMITTNFITVPKDYFGRIRKSDWVRLCFADAAGEGWPYCIYDCDWRRFHAEHVFDWFYGHGTRQLFAGFNHAMVCASDGYPENVLVHHFRRHYFQMALLAQFEFATLLAFSSRITRAVSLRRAENGDESFRKRFIQLRRDFLHFVHEFRFTGVSNQMQGRAMYEMWRKHLGLNELFHDVEDELRSGSDYLLAIENREQTDASMRLNIIVGLGAAIGLPLAFAGTAGFKALVRDYLGGEWFATLGAVMFVTLLLALAYGVFSLKGAPRQQKRIRRAFLLPILLSIVMILSRWYDIPPLTPSKKPAPLCKCVVSCCQNTPTPASPSL